VFLGCVLTAFCTLTPFSGIKEEDAVGPARNVMPCFLPPFPAYQVTQIMTAHFDHLPHRRQGAAKRFTPPLSNEGDPNQ
jgi:hypothetical protein